MTGRSICECLGGGKNVFIFLLCLVKMRFDLKPSPTHPRTHPTRAMLPLMLEDFLKVASPGGGGRGAADGASAPPFSRDDIAKALRQTVSVDLHAATPLAPGLTLIAHYAGHVLGAAMFTASGGGVSVTYTGDYNTSADRHLGPAILPRCPAGTPLDLLISESTYATTVRGPKRAREGEFVEAVVRACARGGKVLVPVFALGRAQELMCLLDDAWARLGLTVRELFFCWCGCWCERERLFCFFGVSNQPSPHSSPLSSVPHLLLRRHDRPRQRVLQPADVLGGGARARRRDPGRAPVCFHPHGPLSPGDGGHARPLRPVCDARHAAWWAEPGGVQSVGAGRAVSRERKG